MVIYDLHVGMAVCGGSSGLPMVTGQQDPLPSGLQESLAHGPDS